VRFFFYIVKKSNLLIALITGNFFIMIIPSFTTSVIPISMQYGLLSVLFRFVVISLHILDRDNPHFDAEDKMVIDDKLLMLFVVGNYFLSNAFLFWYFIESYICFHSGLH
jgi:hypothetical protein